MTAVSVSERVDAEVLRLRAALDSDATWACPHLAPEHVAAYICSAHSEPSTIMCAACMQTHKQEHGVELANRCAGCGEIDLDYIHPVCEPLSAWFRPPDPLPLFLLVVVPIGLGLCWSCLTTRENEGSSA